MLTSALACSAVSCALFASCAYAASGAAEPRLSRWRGWYRGLTLLGVTGLFGAVWAAVRVNW